MDVPDGKIRHNIEIKGFIYVRCYKCKSKIQGIYYNDQIREYLLGRSQSSDLYTNINNATTALFLKHSGGTIESGNFICKHCLNLRKEH